MLKFDQTQFDAAIINDPDRLASIAADELFAKNALYADMPYEVRLLLAEAALDEARRWGMNTVPSLLRFVELMVEMTPRFFEFSPFDTLLSRTDLSPDEKTQILMSDESLPHWRRVLKDVDDRNDWHVDYWDEKVDWSRVQLWWGDERWLPSGDAARNDRQAQDALLDHVALRQENIHRFAASDGGLELDAAASEYAQTLAGVAAEGSTVPHFDIAFLGVGPDGHIASLFPGREDISVTDATVISVRNSPKPPPERLSLTLGAPAMFPAFVPGVDRTYGASTTASIVSTAGDAKLTTDGGTLTNGSFSLKEPLQVAFSKSSWDGPASNDVVTIAFKQHIGANDPLRTGSYSKTLTFTLSTTTP